MRPNIFVRFWYKFTAIYIGDETISVVGSLVDEVVKLKIVQQSHTEQIIAVNRMLKDYVNGSQN